MDAINNNNNNSSITEILFFKVWRNRFLRFTINRKLKLFSIINKYSSNEINSFNIDTLNKFAYREYLLELHIGAYGLLIDPIEGTINENQEQRECFYPIPVNCIPKSVTRLTINLNQDINENVIPDSIKTLNFGFTFNKEIKPNSLQHNKNIEELNFGYSFDQPLQLNSLPNTLKSLFLGYLWDQPIASSELLFPQSLTSLRFSNNFNQPLSKNSLPNENLIELIFGDRWNQKIKRCIPNGVKILKFGTKFDQIIKPGDIPESVTELSIKGNYNKPLSAGSIPKNVKKLTIEGRFNQQIKPYDIPSSVIELRFSNSYPLDCIPNTVKTLYISNSLFNQTIIEPSKIPLDIENIFVKGKYEQTLKNYLSNPKLLFFK